MVLDLMEGGLAGFRCARFRGVVMFVLSVVLYLDTCTLYTYLEMTSVCCEPIVAGRSVALPWVYLQNATSLHVAVMYSRFRLGRTRRNAESCAKYYTG